MVHMTKCSSLYPHKKTQIFHGNLKLKAKHHVRIEQKPGGLDYRKFSD